LRLQITIDGRAYAVDVAVLDEDEGPQTAIPGPHTPSAVPGEMRVHAHGTNWDREERVCHSPLTGLVIQVNVHPGQHVEADELMLVLEAMKMETHITAPHASTVKSVFVAQGDSVKQNQILVELK
jgi:biotin carboxyl carrier protein